MELQMKIETKLELPKIGDKIQVVKKIVNDIKNIQIGECGEIVGVEENEYPDDPTIFIRFDNDVLNGFDGNGHVFSFYPECGPELEPETGREIGTLEQFHNYCKIM